MSNRINKIAEKHESAPVKHNLLIYDEPVNNIGYNSDNDSDVSELGTLLTDMSFSDEEVLPIENTVPKGKVNKSVVSKIQERFLSRRSQDDPEEPKIHRSSMEDRYLLHLPRPIIPTILLFSVIGIFVVCALTWFEVFHYSEGVFKVETREKLYTTPFHFVRTSNNLIWTPSRGNISTNEIYENRRLCPSEDLNTTLACAKHHQVGATFKGYFTPSGLAVTENFLKSHQRLKITTFLVFGVPFLCFIFGVFLFLIVLWLEEVFPNRDWWFSLSHCFRWRYLYYRLYTKHSQMDNYKGNWINLNRGEKLLLAKTFEEQLSSQISEPTTEMWLLDSIQYDYQPPLQRTFRIFGWNLLQMSSLFVILALAIIGLNAYFIIGKVTLFIQIMTNLIVFFVLTFVAGLVVHTLLQQWTIRYLVTGSRMVVVNWDLLGYHIQYMWFAKVKRIDTHILYQRKDAGSILLDGKVMFQYVENISDVKNLIHERMTQMGRVEQDDEEADLDSDFEDN